ncbi:hypothetical protein DXG01_014305 [Tephrocybe rancida]|nr:hypothetical protein DXG01_014305 [Tephrocybe rancida]
MSLKEALGIWIQGHGISFVINYTLPQSKAQDQKIKTLWNGVLLVGIISLPSIIIDPTFSALTVQKHWSTIIIDPTSWDAIYVLFRDNIVQVIDGPYKVKQRVDDELGYTEDVNSHYDHLQDMFGDTSVALDLAAAPTPQSEPEPEPVIDIPPGANLIKAIYDIVSSVSFQNPLSPKNKAIKKVNGFKLRDPNLGPLLHTCGRPSSYMTSQTLGLLSVESGERHMSKTHQDLPKLLHDDINEGTGHVENSALAQVIEAHTMGALFSIASHGFLLPDTHRDIVTVQDSMQLTPDCLFAEKDKTAYLTLMSWGSLSPKLMHSKLEAYNKYVKREYEVFLPWDPAGNSATSGTSKNAATAEMELIGLGTLQHFASILYVCVQKLF